jgi:hypothetical protein
MTMFTVRLFDNVYDSVHKISAAVPVGALIVAGVLRDPPTRTTVEEKPAVTFRVPSGATTTETRNFIFVRDGQEVGNADQYQFIGSYFPEVLSEHARHLFEVKTIQ